jgi:hypothetical protein
MKRIFIALIFALTVAALSRADAVQSGQAQSVAAPKVTPPPALPLATLRRDFKGSYPIPIGEKLEYEVRFSRFPIYATVGIVTFEYLGALPKSDLQASTDQSLPNQPEPLIKGLNVDFKPSPDQQLLHLRATAVSKGLLIAILGFDVKDRFETFVDASDFSARLSFKEQKEGKKHLARSAVFDLKDQQVKYLTTDLTKPDAPPRAKLLPAADGMMSLLSAFYFVRFQKLKEDQMIRFPVSTDEENYTFDIVISKREKINTDCGKIKTVRLQPKLFGPGQLFSRQGEMTMWVSDDSKHTPLRLVARTSAGTVTAKLLNFKKNCQIIEPEAEEPVKTENRKKK